MFHRSWGLMLIQANLDAPCRLLDFPTLERFIRELETNRNDIIGIGAIIPNAGKVKKMCERVREHRPDAKIVIGGHVADLPDVRVAHPSATQVSRPASPALARLGPLGYCRRVSHRRRSRIRSTTILSVRRDGQVALGGDGQVTLGETMLKHDAVKIRRLVKGTVLCGFAGSTADAFALLERFEAKLDQFQANMRRAAIELAKEWRTDRNLRRLESLLAVVDHEASLILSGSGDVIEPSDGVVAIGSGGPIATAAARALLAHSDLTAEKVVETALDITGDICIYTNRNVTVEVL